jgi:hypothetical protein
MKPLRDFRNYPLFFFTLNLSLCALCIHPQALPITDGGTGISAVTANRSCSVESTNCHVTLRQTEHPLF